MKRKIAIVTLLVLAMCVLSGCCLSHDWEDATCEEPKTCLECGKTEGEPLEHDWEDATCQEPKTCAECGETKGKTLRHDWQDATCGEPKTCSECGETKGDPLEHSWKAATCETPKVCTECGEEEGDSAGHVPGDGTIQGTSASGYRYVGACAVCGEEDSMAIDWYSFNKELFAGSWNAYGFSDYTDYVELPEGASYFLVHTDGTCTLNVDGEVVNATWVFDECRDNDDGTSTAWYDVYADSGEVYYACIDSDDLDDMLLLDDTGAVFFDK